MKWYWQNGHVCVAEWLVYKIYYRKDVINLIYKLTKELRLKIFSSGCLLKVELWERSEAILYWLNL